MSQDILNGKEQILYWIHIFLNVSNSSFAQGLSGKICQWVSDTCCHECCFDSSRKKAANNLDPCM